MPGIAAAASLSAGKVCITSPRDEVFIISIFITRAKYIANDKQS